LKIGVDFRVPNGIESYRIDENLFFSLVMHAAARSPAILASLLIASSWSLGIRCSALRWTFSL
jgi:hypothetical protein